MLTPCGWGNCLLKEAVIEDFQKLSVKCKIPTIIDSAVLPQNSGFEIVIWKDNRLGAGGVLIAVKNTFIASPVADLDTDCAITWSCIKMANSKPLFIGSF